MKLSCECSVAAAPEGWTVSWQAETVSCVCHRCGKEPETYPTGGGGHEDLALRGLVLQNFELDESQITKLANTTASDFQPSQGNQPARKKPSWMKTTHAPEVATEPTHNTGGFDAYRHSSDEKGTEEGRGEGTTHVPTRTSAGFASQTAEREVSSNATLSSSIQPFLNYLIVRSGTLQRLSRSSSSVDMHCAAQV